MNILLIISSNEGTIAGCAYQLYRGILKEAPEHKVYVVCYGKYSENGFNFGSNCFKLSILRKNKFSSIILRTIILKRIKCKYKINNSISTQVGASVWNVLSSVGEFKTGIFHAILEQAKAASLKRYISFYVVYNTILKFLNKKIGVSQKVVQDINRYIGGGELAYNIHDVTLIREKSTLQLPDIHGRLFNYPVILYVGRLYEKIKAPSRLLEAFAIFKSKIQENCQLVYIGPDDNGTMANLNVQAEKLGLRDCVHFIGQTSNPYKYMKRAKFLVSPSRDEGLPGVLIESLLLKVPCVATNSTLGNWEIMQCEKHYNPNLKEIFSTPFGYITPNIIEDETYTIKMLAKGMLVCYYSKDIDFSSFDESRFSSKIIVDKIIRI